MSDIDATQDGINHPTYIDLLRQGTPEFVADQHNEQFDEPMSPLDMPPGQIDGLESLPADSYMNIRRLSRSGSESSSLHGVQIPGVPSPAELAASAMQYLPYPVMILDGMKTLIMANDAMGRLLGAEDAVDRSRCDDDNSLTDRLRGQTLSQIGIDMLQDGRPVWVNWDSFMDSLAYNSGKDLDNDTTQPESGSGDVTPTVQNTERSNMWQDNDHEHRSTVHDSVIEVLISSSEIPASYFASGVVKAGDGRHTFAKMIITVWKIDSENYFTLTFTNTDSSQTSLPSSRGQSRQVTKLTKSKHFPSGSFSSGSRSHSSPGSVGSGRSSNHGSSNLSAITSPTSASMSASPFPPLGSPSRSYTHNLNTPSSLQKVIMMKDALLDNTEVPILAMWKDESVAIPNKAARRLFHPSTDLTNIKDGFDLVSKWDIWDETFTTALDPSEYPISVLVRTQRPFSSHKIGMIDPETNQRLVLDCLGEAIRDENTGEFLAGLLTCRDITQMTDQITKIKEKEEQRFQLICESMPQMIWTTTPEGMHDWFSEKWYEYTGLTEEESLGMGWQLPFHLDDMAVTSERWAHSLRTGDPYTTEYRCRRKDGEWRWMLGRALPMKNKQTGEIEKWLGTCTDIHEAVQSRFEAKRTRQQLLSVIAHAQVTLFSVDRNRNLTLLEGAFIWNLESDDESGSGILSKSENYIGKNIYEVYGATNPDHKGGQVPPSLQAVEDILTGKTMEEVYEHCMDGRWYRTRFVPVLGKKDNAGQVNEAFIDGVIGVSMDVTEVKDKEETLQQQEKENARLLANEAAAKEASRLKSQFLANMSHEIRTPIAGVIGMAELLSDTDLDNEQRECAENIQRSANGLLTVINDILDFSKVESGRLDIEEVQFSLSVVIRDVSKMLGFAAERKNLTFESDISAGIDHDLILMGDPGRVRQIITNLLTNSIKFTSEGRVKFSVMKERETAEIMEIKFVVEDTGIGIEEEVRKRLFKPFSQADSSTARRFGGTGLGLTISKNLVDLMHGRISLDSSLGNGTIATFCIPFNKPQYQDGSSALVDIGDLPDRLQSEMSVSCNSSDYEMALGTPPTQSPNKSMGNYTKDRSVSNTPPVPPELELPIAERANVKILLVEDNAINQQIALKTIRKLGFTVSAVWNGKEALDHLLAADSPNPPHPKPDLILMDVQMPVIDGYRATHLIRHHEPYKLSSREIPIVAMTASAIQGDREKCKKAGMDDYLAKPVKGKALEKMIVKWAINRRLPRSPGSNSVYDDSECSEPGDHNCQRGQPQKHTQKNQWENQTMELEAPRPTMSERQNSHRLTLPGAESEGDRAERRDKLEEKALELRDEKLVEAAGPGDRSMTKGGDWPEPRQKLTVENVGKLEREGKSKSKARKIKRESTVDSMGVEGGATEESYESRSSGERPKVPRRWQDSERTITGHDG